MRSRSTRAQAPSYRLSRRWPRRSGPPPQPARPTRRACRPSWASEQRVAQVVQHAEEEHYVEDSDGLNGVVVDVEIALLDARAESVVRQLEAVVPPVRRGPDVVVGRQHAGGAAALGLERKESVPA